MARHRSSCSLSSRTPGSAALLSGQGQDAAARLSVSLPSTCSQILSAPPFHQQTLVSQPSLSEPCKPAGRRIFLPHVALLSLSPRHTCCPALPPAPASPTTLGKPRVAAARPHGALPAPRVLRAGSLSGSRHAAAPARSSPAFSTTAASSQSPQLGHLLPLTSLPFGHSHPPTAPPRAPLRRPAPQAPRSPSGRRRGCV